MSSIQAYPTSDSKQVGRVLTDGFSSTKFQQYLSHGKTYEETLKQLTTRSQQFMDIGAEVVQAGDFSAVAIWIPPNVDHPPPNNPDKPDPRMEALKAQYKAATEKHFKDKPFWELMFLARDPSKQTKGAVSAIVKPFLQRAQKERIPAVLFCIAEHAKEVYHHFGFKVLETIPVGVGVVNKDNVEDENGEGITTYLMAYNY